jgi:hypothetical protein
MANNLLNAKSINQVQGDLNNLYSDASTVGVELEELLNVSISLLS